MQDIYDAFTSILGRNPNNAELGAFTDEFNSGRMKAFDLQNFLKGTSEYKLAQAPKLAASFGDIMKGSNADAIKEMMAKGYKGATADFQAKGRPISSGLDSKYAQVAGDVTRQFAPQNFGVTANMLANYFAGIPSMEGAGVSAAYGGRTQKIQNDFTADQAAIDRRTYADYYDRSMKQSKENQWFQLAGGLLHGGASIASGGLAGGYF